MRITAAAASAIVALGAILSLAYAQQNAPPQSFTAQASATPTARPNIDAQFAEAMYRLASARLQRVKNVDRRSSGSVAPGDITRMELQVEALGKMQEAARRNGKLDWFTMLLSEAEMSKTFADAALKRLTTIQAANPALVTKNDLAIAELAAQIAELNLQRGKDAAAKGHEEQQNWGLQFLLLDAQTLQDRVHLLEFRL
jgi:hypothetical protein